MSENNKKTKLDAFKKLEESKNPEILAKELDIAADEEIIETEENVETEDGPKPIKLKKEYNLIDGFRVIPRHKLPFGGVFYPENWEFAYRCPTTKEVANFSTITEGDQPKIINSITDLLKKCFTIVDRVAQKEIPSGQINDGERLYFFLLLREFYMFDKPIEYITMSQTWQEPVTIQFVADGLQFKTPKQGLLDCYDGRKFSIPVEGLEKPIQFLMPTLDISARIFRYILKTYQEANKETVDNFKESEAFNKNFLFVAPYLFVEGNETIESLKVKFKQIEKNDKMLEAYIQIINRLSLTNAESVKYIYKESEEEALIKFPGGWKSIFVNKSTFSNLFD